ncbi:MAG: EamA family transporter [Caldilineaceae bacterium]
MTPQNLPGPAEQLAGPGSAFSPALEPAADANPIAIGSAVDASADVARRTRTGWILGLFATVSFSVAPPIARAAIDTGLNPTEILFIRMWLTSLLLLGTVAIMDRRLLWPGRRCAWIALVAGLVNSLGMMGYF